MNINALRNKLKAPPRRRAQTESNPVTLSSDRLDGASRPSGGPGLGTVLAAAASLALTLAPQAQGAEAAIEQTVQQPMDDIELVLASTRSVATQTDPLLAEKYATPDPVGGKGGVRYHYPAGAMGTAFNKSVTAEFLGPGSPRLTAARLDPNQSSKLYPEGQAIHQLTEPFKECTKSNPDGSCAEAKWESVSYKNISCLYENEATGETVRVLHRSTHTSKTDAMNRGVCAGHILKKGPGKWPQWDPVQHDAQGRKLYVNPAVIVQMEVVNPG